MGFLLFSALAALTMQPSAGDLGAALRRSPLAAPAALPASAPLRGSIVIPLRRLPARGYEGDDGEDASFYVGTVFVGHPAQALQVSFDTASGHVVLPHRGCQTVACKEHRRFSPWESTTAMDINTNGTEVLPGSRLVRGKARRDVVTLSYTQSDLGSGNATGVLVRDSVCVGPEACVDMEIMAALSMDEEPFRGMPNDGIVGLGLQALAAGPLCSFLGRLFEGSKGVRPQIGIAFHAESGELHIGGHERAPLAAPLRWFPVDHPQDGFWQVAIQAVVVGGVKVAGCQKGCHGIVDTGVSRLGVQKSHLGPLIAALSTSRVEGGACQGPDLTLDLGDMALTLKAADYADDDCEVQLGSLDLEEPAYTGVFALGAGVLRRYYAAFDWEQQKLAFAPMAARAPQPVGSDSEDVFVV
eukprot:CAMPEP_0170232236 /NCGR_PEP_ID=MMETSP0116_2-20130129/15858_1 /TAXON_ID=400756 /ORGANISM="Durinskia baltica, Strain CSIRO CS-38" /LENGTH=412 /DNA_ID=CAMNT_0010483019 /DNA_START=97 /DNA_END=1335 /DNA_ORIENTATION=-